MKSEKDKTIKQIPKADFVGFYLDQENQKSNVYFALARHDAVEQDATLYYKVISGKVVYKKSLFKMAASLAVFLVIAVSFVTLFSFSGKNILIVADNSASIKSGLDEVLSAQKALSEFRVGSALFGFNDAYQKFQAARAPRSYLASLTLSAGEYFPFITPSVGDKAKLELESDIARAGMALAKSVEPILKMVQVSIFKKDLLSDAEDQFFGESFRVALNDIQNARDTLSGVQKKLENYGNSDFLVFADRLSDVSDGFSRLASGIDLVGWAMGADHQRNFLVVIQNTAQAGATGGIIKSVGLITVKNGRVSKISFDDVYNIDGQLQAKVVPPEPIRKTDTVWGLHRANWFFDFPTSAKKIAYFYQKSQGVDPDGVIAVNDKALEKFLKLIGPIDLLKYDLMIDTDNFGQLTASNIADEKRAAQAKRVFNDAASLIFEKLIALPENRISDFLGIIKGIGADKDLLIWLNNEKYERIVLDAYWGGEVLTGASDVDYLAIVLSDIKELGVDLARSLNIGKQTEITGRGEVINTVTIERRKSEYDQDQTLGGKPKDVVPAYIRLYAPDGSEFISASGVLGTDKSTDSIKKTEIDYVQNEFKTDPDVDFSERDSRVDPESGARIFRESGRAVFGGWIDVASDNPAPVIFKYKLPFLAKRRGNLNFVFQKQPGAENHLDFKVSGPDGAGNIFSYGGYFSKDLFFNAEIRSSDNAQ